ncbi:helix-turn-helix transcriptional regulator [Tsukamurella pseudospumae]|uniref:Transcriptional regulator n=1 Tax=Tsukamurella pseudospumae TaxID=239498 RepID=A0A137ZPQ4_9ACTN|nr:YafY family protein [Tsukamurella pseudospumae]KXP00182.1 transcriptional regulator [Tsukamurella pseudospumae]
MANTSSRTLRLLSLLQTHRYWPGGELADRLEVSVRTLRRDIERLRDLGYPVTASRGVDGGYQLAAGAALPPLVLDDEEAVAIAVGLQTAAQGGIAGIAETSVRALGKVAAVMPPRLRKRVEALGAVTQPAGVPGGPAVDPRILTGLAEACRAEERIEFGYTAADGAVTQRLAEPLRLVPLGRRWYLVAYDLHRHDWRSFRLDRMEAPSCTGVRFRPRELPAADAAAYVRASVGKRAPGFTIEFRVDAPEERVRAAIGRYARIESDGAATIVRMEAESLDWPAMAIAVLDAPVTVVRPPELVDHVAAWARNLARVRS